MIRTITGFSADEAGDWVAHLDCGHRQHVRHRPPFVERPWVRTEEGRRQHVGTPIECPLCARAEPPEWLAVTERLGPWNARTVPQALRMVHRTPHGGWARLAVLQGSARFVMPEAGWPPGTSRRLRAGDVQAIPPGAAHRLVVDGEVEVELTLLAPGEPDRGVP